MVTIDDFSRLVSAIYTSAITPENWIVAMTEIRRALDATGGALVLADETNRSIKSASLPPEAGKAYGEYYCQLDYVLAAVEAGPVGLVHSGPKLMEAKMHSEFASDWMRPYRLQDGLFVRLTGGPTPASFLVAAPRRSESFDTAERVKLMSALVPHLQQALRTQNHVKEVAHCARDIGRAIDIVRYGIVIVATDSHVVHLNSAAERILKSGDGLRIRSCRVEAAGVSANVQLHGSIRGALYGEKGGSRCGNSFTCTRPSAKQPYVIHVLPFYPDGEDLPDGRALLVIMDPEQEPEPPSILLRRLYGMTKAEADVTLRVLRGDGLKPITEELSLSMATIKTHLQHIFDKTGTRRQAELVRLLLAISP
jgi:DNA-binding CsgD family transcriptional regulator